MPSHAFPEGNSSTELAPDVPSAQQHHRGKLKLVSSPPDSGPGEDSVDQKTRFTDLPPAQDRFAGLAGLAMGINTIEFESYRATQNLPHPISLLAATMASGRET